MENRGRSEGVAALPRLSLSLSLVSLCLCLCLCLSLCLSVSLSLCLSVSLHASHRNSHYGKPSPITRRNTRALDNKRMGSLTDLSIDCPAGYSATSQDVEDGSFNVISEGVTSIDACGQLCSSDASCNMFEYKQTDERCKVSSGLLAPGSQFQYWQSCLKSVEGDYLPVAFR